MQIYLHGTFVYTFFLNQIEEKTTNVFLAKILTESM
jgi:hypothetical protein